MGGRRQRRATCRSSGQTPQFQTTPLQHLPHHHRVHPVATQPRSDCVRLAHEAPAGFGKGQVPSAAPDLPPNSNIFPTPGTDPNGHTSRRHPVPPHPRIKTIHRRNNPATVGVSRSLFQAEASRDTTSPRVGYGTMVLASCPIVSLWVMASVSGASRSPASSATMLAPRMCPFCPRSPARSPRSRPRCGPCRCRLRRPCIPAGLGLWRLRRRGCPRRPPRVGCR